MVSSHESYGQLLVFTCISYTLDKMAPKKQKKNADNINSRLAMVTKSGKYCLGYKQTLKTLRNGKAKLVIISSNTPVLRFVFFLRDALKLNIMLCCQRLVSTNITETILNLELLAVVISVFQCSQSLILETQISSVLQKALLPNCFISFVACC
uniref:Large ribosomal subunit protein eL30 n=1 Tax=Panagrolaimus sp. JU765 TaxID=591449 RepID=A0AC34QPM1_9BILA